MSSRASYGVLVPFTSMRMFAAFSFSSTFLRRWSRNWEKSLAALALFQAPTDRICCLDISATSWSGSLDSSSWYLRIRCTFRLCSSVMSARPLSFSNTARLRPILGSTSILWLMRPMRDNCSLRSSRPMGGILVSMSQ